MIRVGDDGEDFSDELVCLCGMRREGAGPLTDFCLPGLLQPSLSLSAICIYSIGELMHLFVLGERRKRWNTMTELSISVMSARPISSLFLSVRADCPSFGKETCKQNHLITKHYVLFAKMQVFLPMDLCVPSPLPYP